MSIKIGQRHEHRAKTYLLKHGLKPISQNFRTKMGEIDLIMKDSDELVFVEVRYRRSKHHGSSAETVTPMKQKRLIRTAKAYLQMKNLFDKIPCRFDVVAMDNHQTQWIKNAFQSY